MANENIKEIKDIVKWGSLIAIGMLLVEIRLSEMTELGKWVVWIVAFFVAIAPSAIALKKDAANTERRNIQHYTMTFTAPLTAVGFILFLLFPSIMKLGWGWIP